MLSVPVDLKPETPPLTLYAKQRYRQHKLNQVSQFVFVTSSASSYEFRSHCVPVDSKNAQVAGKRSWITKLRRAERFADPTEEANFYTVSSSTKERRTLYTRHRRLWSTDRVYSPTKTWRQYRQINRVLVSYLDRPREKPRQHAPKMPHHFLD